MAKKILVVDDNPVVTEALEDILKRRGYEEVITVDSGEKALQLVKEEKPHMVLLDINMPRMGGLDVLKKIKEDDPSVTVIMITGLQDMEVARKSLEIGAYDYITKPFNLEYLETSVFSKLMLVALDKSP